MLVSNAVEPCASFSLHQLNVDLSGREALRCLFCCWWDLSVTDGFAFVDVIMRTLGVTAPLLDCTRRLGVTQEK